MSATKLSDTFTDTNGTALTAHTMNTGPGWTAGTGTFQVQSNAATPNSNNDGDWTVADAGVADCQVDVDVVPRNSGGTWDSNPQLCIRWTDATHHWLVHITSSGGAIQLYEANAGADTLRANASFSFISGNSYAITIVCQGSTITCFVNGAQQWSYSSASSNSSVTKFGLRTGKAGSPSTNCTWDNFKVRELVRFDSASNSGYTAAASSLSWGHNWQGNNRFLSVEVAMLSVNDTVLALTYGGANCTFIGAKTVAGGTGRIEMWGIAQNDSGAPAVGSNTISVTISGTLACAGTAVSRANVHQTTPTESFNSNSGINAGSATDATVVVTPVSDNTVCQFALATNDSSVTASGTSRNNVTGLLGSGCDQDSDQVTPAAATTGRWTGEGTTASWAIAGYAIRPVGATSTAAADLSSAGTSTDAMVGASTAAGAASSAGTSTDAMVGRSTVAAAMASAGAATFSFVGTAITGDGEVFVSAGTSSVAMVGASTAAAAISAAGTSTVAMAGVGLVTIAGDLNGAGTASVSWGGAGLRRVGFYRPGRTDEGQDRRGRADSGDDGRRGRTDESQEYRGRADEPTS